MTPYNGSINDPVVLYESDGPLGGLSQMRDWTKGTKVFRIVRFKQSNGSSNLKVEELRRNAADVLGYQSEYWDSHDNSLEVLLEVAERLRECEILLGATVRESQTREQNAPL